MATAPLSSCFFFFNDTATTEIYTLSLHDALPIWSSRPSSRSAVRTPTGSSRREGRAPAGADLAVRRAVASRSEEHTSELQSQSNIVCRLLLEKKKKCSHTYAASRVYESMSHAAWS